MRVLHYCSRVRPVAGGAERQFARLVRSEVLLGAHVEALSPDADPAFPAVVHTLDVASTGRGGLMRLMLAAFREVRRLRREFDVVHVHGVGPVAAAVVVAARLSGLPSVTGLRSSGFNADWLHVERLHGRLVGGCLWRLQFACSTALAVKTVRMADEVRGLAVADRRIQIVPNGIDLDAYAAVPEPSMTARRLLYLGRMLVETKGLDVLAAAWRSYSASEAGAGWVLSLCGGGPDMAAVRALFDGLDTVSFGGLAEEVTVPLASSTAVVLPSRVEGFSNVLLEALASGRPVIGTRVSGTEDVLDVGCGWVAEPGDPNAMERCLRDLAGLDEAQLAAMSHAARERAGLYRIEGVAKRWIQLYEGIARA